MSGSDSELVVEVGGLVVTETASDIDGCLVGVGLGLRDMLDCGSGGGGGGGVGGGDCGGFENY